MSSPSLIAAPLDQPDVLAARIIRLQRATAALQELIRVVPAGQVVPPPMRLALRDFCSELATLQTRLAASAGEQAR